MTKIAIVGYGGFAPKHLEVVRALGATVVASCNRSEQGRMRARVECGIPAAYDSISEMVEKERPDGLICTVSFESQHPVGMELLAMGIPTLVEKPPGTSLAQLDELRHQAARHGTPV